MPVSRLSEKWDRLDLLFYTSLLASLVMFWGPTSRKSLSYLWVAAINILLVYWVLLPPARRAPYLARYGFHSIHIVDGILLYTFVYRTEQVAVEWVRSILYWRGYRLKLMPCPVVGRPCLPLEIYISTGSTGNTMHSFDTPHGH